MGFIEDGYKNMTRHTVMMNCNHSGKIVISFGKDRILGNWADIYVYHPHETNPYRATSYSAIDIGTEFTDVKYTFVKVEDKHKRMFARLYQMYADAKNNA